MNQLKQIASSIAFVVIGLSACIYGAIVDNDLTLTFGGILVIFGMITVDG